MSVLLQFSLISHIFLGLLGIILFYAVLMVLFKPIDFKRIKFLRRVSLLGLISFLSSWILGGYYYVVYYGNIVKPLIKKSAYPWAHSIFMEAKEHIFLFLPFAALVAVLIFYILGEELEQKQAIKKTVIILSSLIVILGAIMALTGIIISGAARLR
ncbi:MAG: hypothetical protein UU85_C0002G0019 [Candidatus Wolfebacteria bacterium GW2011_GWA2_42_10]|uniref:Uncharacterized protein n=2 Tax=Candidatus Wolfeibacteriota TaxID=1752735 RepID=A0A0G0XKT7_9BACT|nr:MAG: hypothetical protein UU38_C0003G0018 [Candidatus Wolfebacteria bacterium GW2011_GWB1_41_12]KKS25525.1 MAG: hypothetical protein UU85_C0002G0019 [Candidatus Wolfebacteria bacterium GW2011_GWA2_42_10]KKT56589.1 MAG: hypothetical protein UW50_C0001G0157 [Candidatus Wolfebacteria bacterium GW2011_GWA1_44_24]